MRFLKQRINISKLGWFLAIVLAIYGFGIRMVDLTDAPFDFHPTRQLHGAIIARAMYFQMLPSSSQSERQLAQDLTSATGQYEPPVLERLVAFSYLLMGKENVWVSRIFTSLFWCIGSLALFDLVRRLLSTSTHASPIPSTSGQVSVEIQGKLDGSGQNGFGIMVAALISQGFFLLLPFAVQASRSFQPDPGMVMWIILAAYAFFRWSEAHFQNDSIKNLPTEVADDEQVKEEDKIRPSKWTSFWSSTWTWAILAGVFGGLAVLTKAFAMYMIGALAVVSVLHTLGWRRFWRNPQTWVMALLVALPAGLYYTIGRQGAASEYLDTWTFSLSSMLLRPSIYSTWFTLLAKLMTLSAIVLGLLGIVLVKSRRLPFLLSLWAGYFIFGITVPFQIHTHTYYHLQMTPILAISMGVAILPLTEAVLQRKWYMRILGLLAIMLVGAYLSVVSISTLRQQDYRATPAFWEEIGQKLPEDGKIVALTQDYGLPLSYYGWRDVAIWPPRGERKLSAMRGDNKELENLFAKKSAGKRYFVITAFKQFNDQPDLKQYLEENYAVAAQGDGYLIYDLEKPLE
jgi:4-amino-4-deoxy-L-arabinose transferase-like glycosyltransferase